MFSAFNTHCIVKILCAGYSTESTTKTACRKPDSWFFASGASGWPQTDPCREVVDLTLYFVQQTKQRQRNYRWAVRQAPEPSSRHQCCIWKLKWLPIKRPYKRYFICTMVWQKTPILLGFKVVNFVATQNHFRSKMWRWMYLYDYK